MYPRVSLAGNSSLWASAAAAEYSWAFEGVCGESCEAGTLSRHGQLRAQWEPAQSNRNAESGND